MVGQPDPFLYQNIANFGFEMGSLTVFKILVFISNILRRNFSSYYYSIKHKHCWPGCKQTERIGNDTAVCCLMKL